MSPGVGKSLKGIARCTNYSNESGISRFAHNQVPISTFREFIIGHQSSQIAEPSSNCQSTRGEFGVPFRRKPQKHTCAQFRDMDLMTHGAGDIGNTFALNAFSSVLFGLCSRIRCDINCAPEGDAVICYEVNGIVYTDSNETLIFGRSLLVREE